MEARHAAWIRYVAGVAPAADALDDPIADADARALVAHTGFVRPRPATSAQRARVHGVSGRTRARIAAVTGLAMAAACCRLTGRAVAGRGGASPTAPLPPPPEPFAVPTPRPLPDPGAGALYAPVLRATSARARPDAESPAGRVDPGAPEGTENIVVIEGRATDAGGRVWVAACWRRGRPRRAGCPGRTSAATPASPPTWWWI